MFVDVSKREFVAALERDWRAIRAEALALPEQHFLPWLQREMYDDEDWRVVPLCWDGRAVLDMQARCPRTLAVLAQIPGLAMAVFSRLGPGTFIKPHVGWGDRVHRVHLGLDVPAGCWIEVGGERRTWVAGACLAFDDTVEHAAGNPSSRTRVVLMFDVLRPGLAPPAYLDEKLPHELRAMVPLLEAGLAPRRGES